MAFQRWPAADGAGPRPRAADPRDLLDRGLVVADGPGAGRARLGRDGGRPGRPRRPAGARRGRRDAASPRRCSRCTPTAPDVADRPQPRHGGGARPRSSASRAGRGTVILEEPPSVLDARDAAGRWPTSIDGRRRRGAEDRAAVVERIRRDSRAGPTRTCTGPSRASPEMDPSPFARRLRALAEEDARGRRPSASSRPSPRRTCSPRPTERPLLDGGSALSRADRAELAQPAPRRPRRGARRRALPAPRRAGGVAGGGRGGPRRPGVGAGGPGRAAARVAPHAPIGGPATGRCRPGH